MSPADGPGSRGVEIAHENVDPRPPDADRTSPPPELARPGGPDGLGRRLDAGNLVVRIRGKGALPAWLGEIRGGIAAPTSRARFEPT